MTVVTTVDSYADRISKIASEMQAARVSCDPNTGAAAILLDVAADLRRQVRHKQSIPSRVNFDSISAFGGMRVQAAAGTERPDLPEKITKIFAAARVALPVKETSLTPVEVDSVLREAGVTDIGERMATKTLFEKHRLVNYGVGSLLAGANRT